MARKTCSSLSPSGLFADGHKSISPAVWTAPVGTTTDRADFSVFAPLPRVAMRFSLRKMVLTADRSRSTGFSAESWSNASCPCGKMPGRDTVGEGRTKLKYIEVPASVAVTDPKFSANTAAVLALVEIRSCLKATSGILETENSGEREVKTC